MNAHGFSYYLNVLDAMKHLIPVTRDCAVLYFSIQIGARSILLWSLLHTYFLVQ